MGIEAEAISKILMSLSEQLKKVAIEATNRKEGKDTVGYNVQGELPSISENKKEYFCLSLVMSEKPKKIVNFVETINTYWKRDDVESLK